MDNINPLKKYEAPLRTMVTLVKESYEANHSYIIMKS